MIIQPHDNGKKLLKALRFGLMSVTFIVLICSFKRSNRKENQAIQTPRLMVNVRSSAGFSPQEFAEAASAKLIEIDAKNPYKSIYEHFYNEPFIVITPELNDKMLGVLGNIYGYRFLSVSGQDINEALQQAKAQLESIPKFSSEIPYLSVETTQEIYDLMSRVDRVLTSGGIKYWATYGTLIGAIRHGGLIPWDDDLDISILDVDEHKLKEISAVLDREGLAIHYFHNNIYKIYKKDGMVIPRGQSGEYFPYTFPFVDIFIVKLEKNNENEVIYSHRTQICYYLFNNEKYFYSQIDKLSRVPFGPITIPIPANAEHFINMVYGMPGYPNIWKKVALEPSWDHLTELKTISDGTAFVEIDDYSITFQCPHIDP